MLNDEGELGGDAVVGFDEGAVEEEAGEGNGEAEHEDAAEEEIIDVFGFVGGGKAAKNAAAMRTERRRLTADLLKFSSRSLILARKKPTAMRRLIMAKRE